MQFAVLSSMLMAAVLLILPSVEAHGYLSFPAAVYRNPWTATGFLVTIDENVNPSAFGGKKWNDSPKRNTATFTAAFDNSSFTSLREMVEPFVSDCGNSRMDVPLVDVTGSKEVRWQNDEERKGFVDSHHGPCEVWIDDQRAMHNDDCRATFTTYPAHLPVDYDVLCSGECQLSFYWLALHEAAWQVYKACAPIVNDRNTSKATDSALKDPKPPAEIATLLFSGALPTGAT